MPLAHEQQVQREHAREREPDVDVDVGERPRERDQFDQLRAEPDRLRAIVDSYPADTAREIARLQGCAASERQLANRGAWRAGHWQEQCEDLGLLGRRGQQGRQARERAERFAARAEEQQQQQHADRLNTQARALTESPDGPGAWERAHPDAREQLYEAETQLATRITARSGIGPRRRSTPTASPNDITDQRHVLGAEPDRRELEQHADWEKATRLALQARQQLGTDPAHGPEPVTEQARRVTGFTPRLPGHDRGPSLGR